MGGSDGDDGGGGGRGVLGVNAEYSLQHFIFTKHLCLIGFCEFFKIYRDLDWTVRLDFSNQREITRTEVSVMSQRSLLFSRCMLLRLLQGGILCSPIYHYSVYGISKLLYYI